jgi:uncharacterized membrane protein
MYWAFILLIHLFTPDNSINTDSILTIRVLKCVAVAGERSAIHVYVDIKKGYHVQAHQVTDEFLVPTTIEVTPCNIITTSKEIFPPSERFLLKGTDIFLLVYSGEIEITIPFKTNAEVSKGNYKLKAKLHYQACDDKTCFSPKKEDFLIEITVK